MAGAERAKGRLLNRRPSHVNDEESEFRQAESGEGGVPRSDAIRIGIAAHGVMERIDLKNPAADMSEIADSVLREDFPGIPEPEAAAIRREVMELLENFLASKDFKANIQPFEVLGREVPCFLADTGEDGFRSSVEGYIDLVIRDERGILAIDYKTDRNIDKPKAMDYALERYGEQGRLYAKALANALGEKEIRFGVAFLRQAVIVVWEPQKID
jgi:ATP-dependent helicase/nuclease subunit A